jgi:hypothetical protein
MRAPAITDPFTRLETEGLSMLVLRDGVDLYQTYVDGVRPLLELVDWFPGGLRGATVVDRTVGGCAARVFAYLMVGKVLGLVGSVAAERVLFAEGVEYQFRKVVTEIRNRPNTDTCPFEKLSAATLDTARLIATMRDRLTQPRA